MVEIKLFGTTTVVTEDGDRVVDLGGAKPRQILEILAASAGRPVSKERLAELLWGEDPPRSYVGTLESYVSLLRRRLGFPGGRHSLLATTSRGYQLDGRVAVDVDHLLELARGLDRADGAERIRRGRTALALATSEVLVSSPYEVWALELRAEVEHALTALCLAGAQAALAAHDLGVAVELARGALRRDPLQEGAVILLMRALHASGDRPGAIRAYLDLRERLEDQLGVEPGPTVVALYLDLLRIEGPSTRGRSDHDELRTLLGALRWTLEHLPGVAVPAEDAGLAAVAVMVLGAA